MFAAGEHGGRSGEEEATRRRDDKVEREGGNGRVEVVGSAHRHQEV